MIIVLKPHTTKDDVSRVENMVKKRGLDTHIVQGKEMTVIGSASARSSAPQSPRARAYVPPFGARRPATRGQGRWG